MRGNREVRCEVGSSINRDMSFSERLVGRTDGPLTDVIGVFAAIGFAVAGRLLINVFAPGVLPYSLTFPAVMIATLFAGGRSGTVAVIVCQLLVWYFVLPPQRSFAISFADSIGLSLSTLALLVTVWVVAAYRNAMRRLSDEKEQRLELLALALREVDHRTKNNFQIAAALLLTQANSQQDALLSEELRRAANRLMSIAEVHANLALSSTDLSTVLLHDYLRELCDRVRGAMLPVTVDLVFVAEPVELPARVAVNVGLIVNECLTNAAKHAFPEQNGTLKVTVRATADEVVITIEDDGPGISTAVIGMGSRLIAMLAKPIGAEFERHGELGTSCELRVPLEQRDASRAGR
jgi:two-component sensor histidine kinase